MIRITGPSRVDGLRKNPCGAVQMNNMTQQDRTPMEQIESLCKELVTHYGGGEDPQLLVAAKMLIVALDQFRRYGGRERSNQVQEYLSIAVHESGNYERILQANRNENPGKSHYN
jgi:hypothetical protein